MCFWQLWWCTIAVPTLSTNEEDARGRRAKRVESSRWLIAQQQSEKC